MRKILEGNREKVRGKGLMFKCWNDGMLEYLDWKQHEQLVKTTFKRCTG